MPNIFRHFREKEGSDLQNPSCHSFLGKDTNLCVTHLWKEGYDGLFLSNEKKIDHFCDSSNQKFYIFWLNQNLFVPLHRLITNQWNKA